MLRDGIVQSRWRLLAAGIVGPALAALLLCTLGSLWPIRLDYRSLQDLHKLEGLGPATIVRQVSVPEP